MLRKPPEGVGPSGPQASRRRFAKDSSTSRPPATSSSSPSPNDLVASVPVYASCLVTGCGVVVVTGTLVVGRVVVGSEVVGGLVVGGTVVGTVVVVVDL